MVSLKKISDLELRLTEGEERQSESWRNVLKTGFMSERAGQTGIGLRPGSLGETLLH